jgi:hypothetical protein
LDLASSVLLGPVGSLVINGVVSIIIWESLVEDVLEGLTSSEGIGDVNGVGLWDSLDHDGKGDVVVIGDVFLLISGSLQDGVEGVVTNNLSERLKGNGLNDILRVGWVNLQGDGLDLIDWDIGGLSEGIEWVGFGSKELSVGWGSWGSLHKLVVMLVVVLLVGLLGALQLSEAAFFKVSFLSLGNIMVLGYHLADGGLDHVLDITSSVGLGTLARL